MPKGSSFPVPLVFDIFYYWFFSYIGILEVIR